MSAGACGRTRSRAGWPSGARSSSSTPTRCCARPPSGSGSVSSGRARSTARGSRAAASRSRSPRSRRRPRRCARSFRAGASPTLWRARSIAPAVREAIQARIEISSAHPADDLDAAVLAETGAGFGTLRHASASKAETAASHAHSRRASRSTSTLRSRTVIWDERSVRLRGGGFEVDADRAVIAVPATAVERIHFEPLLPPAKAAALAGVRYGQAAKLHVALRSPVEPSAVLAVPERYWSYTQLGPDGLPAGFAGTFAGTEAALSRLQVEQGPERWLASLAALRPELDLEPGEAMLTTWRRRPLGARRVLGAFALVASADRRARPPGRPARVRRRAHRRRVARTDGGSAPERPPSRCRPDRRPYAVTEPTSACSSPRSPSVRSRPSSSRTSR